MELIGADEVDAAFEIVEGLAGGDGGGGIVGHEPLISAVQGGLDQMRVFHIHAQHIRHQSADEAELLIALPQHALDAFADAFALGFKILQQLLPRDEPAAMLLGGAQLLGQRRDLLAQIRRIAALSIELPLLRGDRILRRLQFLLQIGALRIEPFDLLNNNAPAFRQPGLLRRDILAFDID